MAATTNPLQSPSTSSPPVSSETHTIAGIFVTVYGLAELPSPCASVASLWLLHPRLQTKDTMGPIAAQVISAWNQRPKGKGPPKGLVAVSFDQRNHGSRMVDELHNQAWREGNPRHAQDMFSCFHGTATDTSQLIDHLESYIFHTPTSSSPKITQHLVLGVSLGGHAAWHCILGDARITGAVVGIGCPDYTRLMADRARLSKRKSYTESTPPGSAFLGSGDFPTALQDAIQKYDPAGLLLPSNAFDPQSPTQVPELNSGEREKLNTLLRERLAKKSILNLSGRIDKLVPYAAGEPFLKVFKQALAGDRSLDVGFEDVMFDGIGHQFSSGMVEKATSWICDLLARDGEGTSVSSKI
ncbi:hypothetical protein P154DRAFT_518236 [Amniculicola lignicola CBS 123094]|uniref:Alpha/beta-hydrolase n=1 Tax=Amniculicola lignicola CBS 123094 TaxID=1392246 RepID=A0A6A5WY07_9PLEO|nr:hypothetical protein P154DRAFT_518236 [Amniculicola lignicola CBS 123094]